MLKLSPTLAGVSKGREGNFENRLFSNISSGKRSRGKIEDSGLNFRISWYKIGKILFVFLSLRDRYFIFPNLFYLPFHRFIFRKKRGNAWRHTHKALSYHLRFEFSLVQNHHDINTLLINNEMKYRSIG